MYRVKDVLRNKGDQVWSVSPDATVRDALQEMAERNIGAVLVMDQGHLAGIFSERDYARKLELRGLRADETPVGEVMTRQVVGVRPDDSVEECMAIMTEKRIRHLPVVDWRRGRRPRLHRRRGQVDHFRAAVPHRAARALYHGHATAQVAGPALRPAGLHFIGRPAVASWNGPCFLPGWWEARRALAQAGAGQEGCGAQRRRPCRAAQRMAQGRST
jgi:hypothetical protein